MTPEQIRRVVAAGQGEARKGTALYAILGAMLNEIATITEEVKVPTQADMAASLGAHAKMIPNPPPVTTFDEFVEAAARENHGGGDREELRPRSEVMADRDARLSALDPRVATFDQFMDVAHGTYQQRHSTEPADEASVPAHVCQWPGMYFGDGLPPIDPRTWRNDVGPATDDAGLGAGFTRPYAEQEPVTPWADPQHDVAGDIQAAGLAPTLDDARREAAQRIASTIAAGGDVTVVEPGHEQYVYVSDEDAPADDGPAFTLPSDPVIRAEVRVMDGRHKVVVAFEDAAAAEEYAAWVNAGYDTALADWQKAQKRVPEPTVPEPAKVKPGIGDTYHEFVKRDADDPVSEHFCAVCDMSRYADVHVLAKTLVVDVGLHERRRARRMQDPDFRESYDRASRYGAPS